jgi:D-alanyl-D-alanine carboxypeptidase
LQHAVDATFDTNVNRAVAVTTRCGTRFFTAGPANLGPHDVHRLGSISKTYLAALMLTLDESGVLHLDDPVARWVDGVPNGATITIRHLLTHRSGLPSPTDDPEVWPVTTPRTWTPRELLAVVARHPPLFAPGARFAYSNGGFLVAGMVAEAATGKPLRALIHERILSPLGLHETFFLPDDDLAGHRLAPGVDPNGVDVTNLSDASWAWGAGSIAATPSDAAVWMHSLGGGRFLDAATQAKLLVQLPTDDPSNNIGLGVFVYPAIGPAIGHDGFIDGYQSHALYFVDHEATVAAFVDRWVAVDRSDSTDLLNAAYAAMFGGG